MFWFQTRYWLREEVWTTRESEGARRPEAPEVGGTKFFPASGVLLEAPRPGLLLSFEEPEGLGRTGQGVGSPSFPI